ncbi:MAG: response regulator [Deltaproteobacteria bacterium]|nr:response regulator [Deltaproteobacteria bacterium]
MLKSARQLLAIVNDSLDFSSNGDRSLPEESQQTSSLSLAAELSPLTEAEILVVDDNEANRDLLARYLSSHGLVVTQVANGKLALEKMEGANFDLVLLDIMMPEMDGYQVLEYMKNDESLRHIPVIMISAINELENVVSCIGMGATDYLTKPFNPVLLHARVQSSLERKKWRDQEQHYLQQLEIEQAKSETLLLNILPAPIANRLKRKQGVIADNFEEATVLFADVISFTTTSSRLAPSTLVKSLNILFSTFDSIADEYGLEKIKTIGDAYMAACGIPIPREDHAQAVVEAALDMLDETERIASKLVHPFKIRIGISSGPVTAGVIGKKKFCYDLWGDTVNTASRMSGIGETPHVRITESTFQYAKDHFKLSAPELFEVKGKGNMASFVVLGRKED